MVCSSWQCSLVVPNGFKKLLLNASGRNCWPNAYDAWTTDQQLQWYMRFILLLRMVVRSLMQLWSAIVRAGSSPSTRCLLSLTGDSKYLVGYIQSLTGVTIFLIVDLSRNWLNWRWKTSGFWVRLHFYSRAGSLHPAYDCIVVAWEPYYFFWGKIKFPSGLRSNSRSAEAYTKRTRAVCLNYTQTRYSARFFFPAKISSHYIARGHPGERAPALSVKRT